MIQKTRIPFLYVIAVLFHTGLQASAQEVKPAKDSEAIKDQEAVTKAIEEKGVPQDKVDPPSINQDPAGPIVPASDAVPAPAPVEQPEVLKLTELDPGLMAVPDLEQAVPPPTQEETAAYAVMPDDSLTASEPEDLIEEADALPVMPFGNYNSPNSYAGNSGYSFDGISTGFDNGPVFIPQGDPLHNLVKGFSFSTNLTSIYNSNVTRGNGLPGTPESSDFIIGLGGTVSYLSSGKGFTFGGNYSGSYDQYVDHTDFSGFNQNGGLVANYNGGKISATLTAGLSFGRGSNRDYAVATVIDQTTINTNLSLRYAYSAKTSITTDMGYSYTTASGVASNDRSSFNLGAAALWRYSPLTEFGPGVRYTTDSGGGSNDRSSIGPTLSMNYKLSSKVSINSRIGLDFASYSNGGSSQTGTSAAISMNYEASRLWGMNLAFDKNSRADGSVSGAFNDVSALRVGYHRKIRRANLNLGMGYESSSTENSSGIPGAVRPDRNYFTMDASLGMPVFYSSSYASLFFKYSDQSADVIETYNSTQLGLSLSRSF